jgi:WD40 repeat protein
LQAILLAIVATLLLVVAGGAVAFGVSSRYQAGLLRQENLRASTAETEAVHRLYEAEVAHAQASRWSRRPGQHFASLDAIDRAARILPRLEMAPDYVEEQRLILRNEAIAAMTLYDVRDQTSIETPAGWTNSVCYSPDFARYALSAEDGRVSVRRLVDGKQLHLLEGPGHRAWVLQFSPDGRYLAGKFHKGTPEPTAPVIAVWDLTSEARVVFVDEDLNLGSFDFAADSRSFAYSTSSGLIRVCSLEDGGLLREQKVTAEPTVLQCNSANDAMAISTFGKPSLAIWDFETDELRAIPAHARIKSMDWSPDGQLLAIGCWDGCIHLLDSQNDYRLKRRLAGHIANVVRLYFNAGGDVLVSRSWDGTTRVWDLTTGTNSLELDHGGHVASGFSSTDDAIGFVSQDQRFGIWEIARGGPLRILYDQDRAAEKRQAAFHPTIDRMLCVATPEGVELWDIARRTLIHVLDSGDTQSVLFMSDGHTMLTCGKRGVLSWPVNVSMSPELKIHVGSPERVTEKNAGKAELGADGQTLAFEHNFSTALIFDLHSGEFHKVEEHLHLNTITISPDSKWVVTATWQGRGVRVWDVESGECIKDLLPEASSASVRFSPNGEWLAASDGTKSYIWRPGSWELLHELPKEHPDGWPGPVAFSPDSRIVVLAHSRYVAQLTDPRTGRSLGVLEAPERDSLGGYAFNADGTRLAITEGKRVQLWDLSELRRRLVTMTLDWDTPTPRRRTSLSADEPMSITADP